MMPNRENTRAHPGTPHVHAGLLRALSIAAIILACATHARATPTQEEVFQSINQNVGSTVDISKAIPYLLAAVSMAIMAGLYNYYRKRRTIPRRLNNPMKLSRELSRRISLRSVELRQLKLLAEEQEIEHPLTLILCPSLLGKAIRSPSPRVDRAVVKQIVGRLKQGLGG
jgi:hypothetical protein